MKVRQLGSDDLESVHRLTQLAFGYRSDTLPAEARGFYGIDGDDGRLLAVARVNDYEQLWGGRRVRMGGIASVVVHPDGRGRGLSSALMRGLLPTLRGSAQPISVLFPTGIGIYRPVGWEVVGTLDDTPVPVRDLRTARDDGDVVVRTAGPQDVPEIARLYAEHGGNGLLTREGPEFPTGAEGVLEHDVVALAQTRDGTAVGYASYNRGTGYRGAEIRLWDFVAATGPAATALLRSLASWSTVASTVLWRGPTTELQLHVTEAVPAPSRIQPWMLRIVDAPAAIAARGFAGEVTTDVAFGLHDPDVPEHARTWRLRVADGAGELVETGEDAPVLHVRGLALLYAGVADSAGLVRSGLLERPLPGLSAAFAGPAPQILDYF